jgi:acylphosphatase
MNRCRRFLVSGRVQGVFYRAGAQDVARRLGLTGWVCNLSDGRVELVACGEETKLKELETWLRRGPPHARVERVEAGDVPPQAFDGFTVTRQGR